MMEKIGFAILLAELGGNALFLQQQQSPKLSLAVTDQSYTKDCTPRSLRKHSFSALEWEEALYKGKSLPGVGTDLKNIKPFEQVYKDGFSYVDCVKDVSYHERDMHGDGKFSYKVGNTNVSIIHYTEVVPREDQKKMTPEVCFKFCRTLQHMNFFGLHSGRDCYCSPFFQRSAGDSSQCDAVCEGDKSEFCGGMKKSAVFELHMCSDLEQDMLTLRWDADVLRQHTSSLAAAAKVLADDMTAAADEEQKMWGMHGDPDAAALMQISKVWAGDILRLVESATSACDDLSWDIQKADSMKGYNFATSDIAEEADRVIGKLEKHKIVVDGTRTLLQMAYDKATRGVGEEDERGQEYYPIMYFVKNSESEHSLTDYPSTCTGEWDQKTVFNANFEECSRACDDVVSNPECKGFFLSENSLCFLFSKFTKVQYYTECPFDIHYKYHKDHHKHFHDEPHKGPQPHFLAKSRLRGLIQHNHTVGHKRIVNVEPSLESASMEVNNLDGSISELPPVIILSGVGPSLNLKIEARPGYKPKNVMQTGFKHGNHFFGINVGPDTQNNKATFDFTFIDDDYEEVIVENIPFSVFDLDGPNDDGVPGFTPEILSISGFENYHVDENTYLHIRKERGGQDSGTYSFEATHYGAKCDNPADPDDLGPQKCTGLNSLWASVGFLFKHKSKFTLSFDIGPIAHGRIFEFSFSSTHTKAIPRTTTPPPTTTEFTTPLLTKAPPTKAPPTKAPPTKAPPAIVAPTKTPPTKAPPLKTALVTTTQFMTPTTTPRGPGRPAGCYAKLEDFEGTDLSPELYTAATGRNNLALKELKRADRCYK